MTRQAIAKRSLVISYEIAACLRRFLKQANEKQQSLHLTTSKVMVIVWRLRGNIIWTVLYWQRATCSMGTYNKNSSYSPVGPWLCLCVFWVTRFIFMLVYVLFYLGQLSQFPSCFDVNVTNLNEPPSSFLLPPRCCGLGAGSIYFRAIVNDKQCETRGLFMSLVIHYWIGDVQDCQGVSASEMTYIVSGGALNSTYSLTHSLRPKGTHLNSLLITSTLILPALLV